MDELVDEWIDGWRLRDQMTNCNYTSSTELKYGVYLGVQMTNI